VGKQLFRCGTSVGANYRAACNARSKAEFIAKIGIVVEEADESVFWLELIGDTEIVRATRVQSLLEEARELTAIMAASQRTARSREKLTQ
jgi:four helix bundle protein